MNFSKVDIEGKRSAPDRIYYNGTVINNSTSTTQEHEDPDVFFEDQRQTPLVPDASNYELSVQNFILNGCQKNLPLFIPQMQSNSNSATIYSVQIGVYTGSTYNLSAPTYINWIPENKPSYIPVPPAASVQLESEYYYCYSYTHWVSLVNVALNTAWKTVNTAVGTQCPFLEYDETSGLFSINQDSKTCMVPVGTALPAPYSVTYTASGNYHTGEYSFVGMNTCLELLLSNFSTVYYGPNQSWNGGLVGGSYLPEVVFDTGLPINLLDGSAKATTPVGDTLRSLPKSSIVQLANPFTGAALADAFFVRLPQDYVSTGTIWSPLASFVLVTSQIPVRNESTANPIVLGAGNLGGQSSGGAFQKVLLEVPIDALESNDWRGGITYEPKILTYSSLDPTQDGIQNVDLALYWRNRLTNLLVPVTIPNQGSMSFRLLFKKKLVL